MRCAVSPLIAAATLLGCATALSCVCSPSECEDLTEEDCPAGAGTVWDPCGCCRVCARAEAQPCGGPYGFYGSCAPGLECVLQPGARYAEGICSRPPSLVVPSSCPDAENGVDTVLVSGCNVVDRRCKCSEAVACPGEKPFSYNSHADCQLNLDYLLSHDLADDTWSATTTDMPDGHLTPMPR